MRITGLLAAASLVVALMPAPSAQAQRLQMGRPSQGSTYQNIFRNMDRVQVAPRAENRFVTTPATRRAKVNAIKSTDIPSIRP
jgi:hypothetical protein